MINLENINIEKTNIKSKGERKESYKFPDPKKVVKPLGAKLSDSKNNKK